MCPFDCTSASAGGISMKIHTSHSPCMLYKTCNLLVILRQLRALYLEGNMLSGFISTSIRRIPWRFIFRTSHARATIEFGLQLIKNTLPGQQCAFSAAPIGRIFLKIHSLHPPHMRYKPWKLGSDQSIIKITLPSRLYLGFHSRNFPADSQLVL